MDEHYDFKRIEADAQQHWEVNRSFEVKEDPGRPKFYCLCMLPYPSGALHMGHVRNYTIGDVVSRYQRMLGKNVLQPMGFDAFGLPAENAAIKHNIAPAKWTYSNIEHMRKQLRSLGFAYDWSREVVTCKPEYYRHEQRFFTELYQRGLVYRKNATVNWDPIEQTVLANEQVVDGRGWRSGALVEKKEIAQWFFKITDYAEELLNGLDRLSGWPDSVKSMQRHWIGRSEGVDIDFAVAKSEQKLTVYTTRPDTLFGVTFISVAAEHPLTLKAMEHNAEVRAFVESCRQGSVAEADLEKAEKRGVALGVSALHPITGELLPIYAANFVLMSYGTGAVMAVPGHDQRDYEFARKYGLPIKQVILPAENAQTSCDLSQQAFVEKGLTTASPGFDGLDYKQAFDAISAHLEASDQGKRKVNYRLRDWGVSRQRYWGCPIPMLFDQQGNAIPVPSEMLPVVLPEDVAFEGVSSPIKKDPSFFNLSTQDGRTFVRETDTFDTFVESSWYYARYTSPGANGMVDERAKYWLPIDLYIGGIEHAVMHLMYFRFWHKLMRDAGLVHGDEPATNLLCQGMVVAETYYREQSDGSKEFFNPADVMPERDAKGRIINAKLKQDNQPVQIGPIEKMSKSKANGVDPQALVDLYGADTVRLFSMFAAPPDQDMEWSDAGVEGCARFLRRLWRMVHEHLAQGPAGSVSAQSMSSASRNIRRQLHETLAKVQRDVGERYKFNTAIAAIMELMNALAKFSDQDEGARAVRQEAWEQITLCLSPIAPHICRALWLALGKPDDLLDRGYPVPDPAALIKDSIKLVVQVNGKLRGEIEVPADAGREHIEQAAQSDPSVLKHIEGMSIKKLVVVPGKLVNIVVAP
jgi:leucyl-tRNA synthetase